MKKSSIIISDINIIYIIKNPINKNNLSIIFL